MCVLEDIFDFVKDNKVISIHVQSVAIVTTVAISGLAFSLE
jgi:hypothetical protein